MGVARVQFKRGRGGKEFLTLVGEEEAWRIHFPCCCSIPTTSNSLLAVLSAQFLNCFGPVFMARRLLSVQKIFSLPTYARQHTAAEAEAMASGGRATRECQEVSQVGGGGENNKRRVFWIRDPATGDWIPENHFGETDIAEVRQKLLSSKQ
nr:late embryogenesis abundant protein LEA83 [Pinus tabuliformis]